MKNILKKIFVIPLRIIEIVVDFVIRIVKKIIEFVKKIVESLLKLVKKLFGILFVIMILIIVGTGLFFLIPFLQNIINS